MHIPPSALLPIAVVLGGAAMALAGFFWAVNSGQLDPGNSGGEVIFEPRKPDESEDAKRRFADRR